MSPGEMTDYYRDQLEDAQIFQDWLMKELLKSGIVLQVFSSKEYQIKQGESMSWDEVKFDKRQPSTGNLAIETYEKTDPRNWTWAPSGIHRQNIIRWIHGNYETVWIFDYRTLRDHVLTGVNRQVDPLRTYEIPTSKGILLPAKEADRICSLKMRFKDKEFKEKIVVNRPNVVPYETILPKSPRKDRSLFDFGEVRS